jgi:hypothetical protein
MVRFMPHHRLELRRIVPEFGLMLAGDWVFCPEIQSWSSCRS